MRNPRKVMQAYMSPGSVTEILHFFVAEYSRAQRVGNGGGVEEEDIEVMEISFDQALAGIASGEIRDGKTIMLLQYAALHLFPVPQASGHRSEERRVGKECRSRWSPYH